MTTKVSIRLSAIAVLFLAVALPGFGQTTQSAAAFVAKLVTQLEQDGWNVAASTALADAASRLDWGGTTGADPQAVALALEFGTERSTALTPIVQAQVALQLALSSVKMEKAGMNRQSVAIAALNAVRDSLPDLQTAIANHAPGSGVGNLMGKAVSTAVRNQIRSSVGPQISAHASVGQGMTPKGSGGSYGPSSGMSGTPGSPGTSTGTPVGRRGPGIR
jgi:hypothetical protein